MTGNSSVVIGDWVGSGGITHKGTWANFWEWRLCSLCWLWWWYQGCMSQPGKLYTLNMCSVLNINYTSMKLWKRPSFRTERNLKLMRPRHKIFLWIYWSSQKKKKTPLFCEMINSWLNPLWGLWHKMAKIFSPHEEGEKKKDERATGLTVRVTLNPY